MKVHLAYNSGFSFPLVSWEATMIVGSRGSLRVRRYGPSGSSDRTKPRHDFGLDAIEFLKRMDQICSLPDPIQPSTADDAAVRHIRLHHGSLHAKRHRSVWLGTAAPTRAEELFDALWINLLARVRAPLLELGIAEEDFLRVC